MMSYPFRPTPRATRDSCGRRVPALGLPAPTPLGVRRCTRPAGRECGGTDERRARCGSAGRRRTTPERAFVIWVLRAYKILPLPATRSTCSPRGCPAWQSRRTSTSPACAPAVGCRGAAGRAVGCRAPFACALCAGYLRGNRARVGLLEYARVALANRGIGVSRSIPRADGDHLFGDVRRVVRGVSTWSCRRTEPTPVARHVGA